MAKKTKILLTLTNPPEGMHPSQLFDNRKHLNDWLEANKEHLQLQKVTDTGITFGQKNEQKEGESKKDYKKRISAEGEGNLSTGKIKEVPHDHVN